MARNTVRNAYVSSWLSVNERPTSVSMPPWPFAFKPWFDDPRMKGFMDGVSYQNNEWAKQEAVKYDDGSVRVVDPTLTLMCEYILQILLHCGRLRAVVSVRKYLVNAVAELRAREAAEPDE